MIKLNIINILFHWNIKKLYNNALGDSICFRSRKRVFDPFKGLFLYIKKLARISHKELIYYFYMACEHRAYQTINQIS